jgi:hypothetical protein
MIRRAGLYEQLGRERMLFDTRAAIERYHALQAEGDPMVAARQDGERPVGRTYASAQ